MDLRETRAQEKRHLLGTDQSLRKKCRAMVTDPGVHLSIKGEYDVAKVAAKLFSPNVRQHLKGCGENLHRNRSVIR